MKTQPGKRDDVVAIDPDTIVVMAVWQSTDHHDASRITDGVRSGRADDGLVPSTWPNHGAGRQGRGVRTVKSTAAAPCSGSRGLSGR